MMDRPGRLAVVLHMASLVELSGPDLRQLADLLDVAGDVETEHRAAGLVLARAVVQFLTTMDDDESIAEALAMLPEEERWDMLHSVQRLGLHLEHEA